MEKAAVLAHLCALLERQPDWSAYSEVSREHKQWLAQARALVRRWRPSDAIDISMAIRNLGGTYHAEAVGKILQAVEDAIADLEFDVPSERRSAFGAGDVYDIFRELRSIVGSAEHSLFIVDPYLDPKVFDLYLDAATGGVNIRLLCNRYAGPVSAAAQRFGQQRGLVVEVRQTNDAHDRVIFLDHSACFAVGQSLKDAANAKPTYIAALAPDVTIEKLRIYEQVWNAATVV